VNKVECDVFEVPGGDPRSLNTAQDNCVVQVETDSGFIGIGEVEANPWVIKAIIEASGTHTMDQSLARLVIGRDPRHPRAIWDYLYRQTLLTGRRGAGINAIGAVDMAIWDVYGKVERKPIWQLLGGARRQSITPYASLLPSGFTLGAYRSSLLTKAAWARDAGFHAVKIEVMIKGPHAHAGLQETDEAIVELVAVAREALGPDIMLIVDVGYCWNDWKEALRVIKQIEKFNLFFVETPLSSDDLPGYARLTRSTDVRIAAGELLSTRFEFESLIDKVDVLQPDIGRVGGITEAMRVVELAGEHGKLVVPHCWKSGIGTAATAHVAAASSNCPFIEYLPPEVSDSAIRRELVSEELRLENGHFALPQTPGLGVALNPVAVEKFRITGGSTVVDLGARN
jgi:L-alanine-DL-glutamate epimerase-like enolase superfamily enzyme